MLCTPKKLVMIMSLFVVWSLSMATFAQEGATPSQKKDGPPVSQEETSPVQTLTIEKIAAKIKEIEDDKDLDEEVKKKALELYKSAQSALQKATEHRTRAQQYKEAIEASPEKTKQLREQLELQTEETPVEVTIEIPANAKAKDMEVQRAKEEAEKATAEAELDKKKKLIESETARPEKVRQERDAAKKKLEEIEAALKVEPAAGTHRLLVEAGRAAFESQQRSRTEELAMLEQELLSQPMRLELLTVEHDLATKALEQLTLRLKKYEEIISTLRSREAEQVKIEAERAQREAMGKHQVIKDLAKENSELGEESLTIVGKIDHVSADRELKVSQGKQLKDVYDRIKLQLEKSGLSSLGGNILRKNRQTLPELLRDNQRVVDPWRGQIPEVEAKLFEKSIARQALNEIDRAVKQVLDEKVETSLPQEQRDEIAIEVRKYLVARQELLKKYSENYNNYLKQLRALQSAQEDLEDTAEDFATLLDEWLLWMPSITLPNMDTIKDCAQSAGELLAPANWLTLPGILLAEFKRSPFLHVAAVLLLVVLIAGRFRMRQKIVAIAEDVRKVQTDNFKLTLKAMVLTILLAISAPVIIGFIGWRLFVGGMGAPTMFASGVGYGLLRAAELVLYLGFFLALCRPGGVAEVHFRWRQESLKLVRRHLMWLLGVLVATDFIESYTEVQTGEVALNSLGRLAFVMGLLALTVFTQRVLRLRGSIIGSLLKRRPDGWLSRLRYIWYPLAVGLPFGLAVTSICGYHYTAQSLAHRVVMTIWLIAGTIILYHLALRWLILAERRLALAQAQEKREAEAKAAAAAEEAPEESDEGPAPVVETSEVTISTIDEQSRQLLRTLTAASILVGLWLIWASVLPALAILGEVELWSSQVQVAGETATTMTMWITLEHLALAIVTLILTVAASKNLPGVLELLVLKNLPLEPSIRYAITTVMQYVLVGVGVVAAFNLVGFGWSKVQWLVAALSVGIGFGLQEIIANFVCGLILLFERPIRVGDIVKVGDVMGTVSRIRIRATTITDWNRMEYVVPNKELIVGRLLNWTLSNTINRIVITIGVAYGSNTEKARELLLKVCNDHPLIMADPAPLVNFEGFGDSTLNMVVRCYLPDFANRLGTIHELHTTIDRAFKEAGIEIAFPQRDLHLRSADPSLGLGKSSSPD